MVFTTLPSEGTARAAEPAAHSHRPVRVFRAVVFKP